MLVPPVTAAASPARVAASGAWPRMASCSAYTCPTVLPGAKAAVPNSGASMWLDTTAAALTVLPALSWLWACRTVFRLGRLRLALNRPCASVTTGTAVARAVPLASNVTTCPATDAAPPDASCAVTVRVPYGASAGLVPGATAPVALTKVGATASTAIPVSLPGREARAATSSVEPLASVMLPPVSARPVVPNRSRPPASGPA